MLFKNNLGIIFFNILYFPYQFCRKMSTVSMDENVRKDSCYSDMGEDFVAPETDAIP